MFYEPFTKIEEVEPFFGHSIYKDGKEMTVIGATVDNKVLFIQAVYVDEGQIGTEISSTSLVWFYSAKYMGHPFGKEMKNEKEF